MSYFNTPILTASVVASFLTTPATAATIDYAMIDGLNTIHISGMISRGDSDRFERLTRALAGPTAVLLSSEGGVVLEALMIGETIRSKAYATVVQNDAECASSCGLIWLAGANRFIGTSAKVGFHAAYVGSGDDAHEIGLGNALIGAYLTKLGLSYEAVAFVTSASPHEINWLHPADAREVGIQCITLPDPEPEKPSPGRAAQSLPDGSPLERRMMSLMLSYYAIWSQPGTNVERLTLFYNDTVIFYGSTAMRSRVMEEKRKFSTRWPIRNYIVRPSTLFVQCSDTCSVTGVVEWDVSSVERGAHSVGSANFVIKIAPVSSEIGGVILSENGSVLASYADNLPSAPEASAPPLVQQVPSIIASPEPETLSPAQMAASSTTAYAEGRQARSDYERWFASVPDGPYKDGVVFWAGNRSLKSPPSCAPPGSPRMWQQGCEVARARLTPVDARRKTEKDFWWGWNSL